MRKPAAILSSLREVCARAALAKIYGSAIVPFDKNGNPLQIGDHVLVPCKVVGTSTSENDRHFNIALETDEPVTPGGALTFIELNSKQVVVNLPPNVVRDLECA